MRVEEFKKKTDDELLQTADDCFGLVEARGVQEEPAHLLKAQFYMNEVDRRHDAKIARRDFLMELIVIALILLEVIIGVGGIAYSVVEGNKQAEILDRMDKSTAATATATRGVNTSSQDQAAKLKTLADEQTKSLASLGQMNDKLQSSLRRTGRMVSAMEEQLKILKEEQAIRQAQLAKKPKLEINISGSPLISTRQDALKAREFTATRAGYDLSLTNSGDATATGGLLRVMVMAKDVNLDPSSGFQRPYEEPDSAVHTFLLNFGNLRPRVTLPMRITFVFPKGQEQFMVMLNVDADEIATGTYLGSMQVTPPKE